MKYYRVIDNQSPVIQKYLRIIFIRDKHQNMEKIVSLLMWFRLCFIELLFGEELLESFVTTASNSGCNESKDEERKFGDPKNLNLHIPSGIFTNIFRSHLIQVLYYKYYLQYGFILPIHTPVQNDNTKTIDVSCIKFRLDKKLLYLIIPFRRIYILFWLLFNITFDLLAYVLSDSLNAVIVVGLSIEAVRRLFKL